MRKAMVLLLFLALVIPASAAKLSEVEMMAYRVKPAVVLIENVITAKVQYRKGGQSFLAEETFWTAGSAFFINPNGYLVTNGHVVQPYYMFQQKRQQLADVILNYFVVRMLLNEGRTISEDNFNQWVRLHNPKVISIQVSPTVTLSNGEKFIYEIKKYSPPIDEGGKDIAVIKIERDNCPVLMLGDSAKIKLQQEVFPIGYPAIVDTRTLRLLSEKTRLEPTITRGAISALRMDFKGVPVIQTDATITFGNSGGPAVNVEGRVIGISTYTAALTTPFGNMPVQGYGFLIPINTAKEFIRDVGVEYNVMSEFTKTYNELMDAVWNEDWFKARELVVVALSYMRNQPDLEKLQQKIYMEIDRMGWFEKMWKQNKLAVVIVIALVIVIIGIIFVAFKPSGVQKEEQPVSVEEAVETAAGEGTVVEGEVFGYAKVVVRGQELGKYPIPSKGVIVGRDSARCDVVISEPTVSKTHCKIIPKGEGFYVVDLGSTNGTFLKGAKITEAPAAAGATVQLGRKGAIIIILEK